jgi:hypothetical protein
MLNRDDENRQEMKIGAVAGEWCVGEPPVRWDVGLGARLAETIRQLFWRDRGERAFPIQAVPEVAEGPKAGRKAA